MNWVMIIVALIVLLGPLRSHAFGKHPTFTLPAIIGSGLGLAYGSWVQSQGAPVPGLPLLCAVIGALAIGGAAKGVLDDLFGRRKE